MQTSALSLSPGGESSHLWGGKGSPDGGKGNPIRLKGDRKGLGKRAVARRELIRRRWERKGAEKGELRRNRDPNKKKGGGKPAGGTLWGEGPLFPREAGDSHMSVKRIR